ncbi:MAG: hypothetical protein HY721_11490 [Planctomycetes bacterium]|nr:hypothetical protein [Planctomycetota bacterium]
MAPRCGRTLNAAFQVLLACASAVAGQEDGQDRQKEARRLLRETGEGEVRKGTLPCAELDNADSADLLLETLGR